MRERQPYDEAAASARWKLGGDAGRGAAAACGGHQVGDATLLGYGPVKGDENSMSLTVSVSCS